MNIKKVSLLISCFVLFSFVALYVYATKIETHQFKIENVTFQKASPHQSTIRIVQISDIELSENYTLEEFNDHIDTINKLQPDVIVFTGDLFENYAKYQLYEQVVQSLQRLQAKYAKLAIFGNNDYGGGAIRIYESLMEEAKFQVLRNESEHITIQQKKIRFVGSDSYLMGFFAPSSLLTSCTSTDDYCILLTHEPESVTQLQDNPFDLILAGHTHGGQVAIPFLQSLFNTSESPYTKGTYKLDDSHYLYVDSGLGTSRMPIRFHTPPQVSNIEITL